MNSGPTIPESDHGPDWYVRRHELEPGMVFQSIYGIVQLDSTVPGDGTKWRVLNWYEYWADEGMELEPGDLRGEPLEGFGV